MYSVSESEAKKLIKDIMIFYKLVTKKTLEGPVVEIIEDKRIFNEGFIGNIFLVVIGLIVIILSIVKEWLIKWS